MKPLLDAHNHLQDEFFTSHLDEIFTQMSEAKIGKSVINGTCEADWDRVAALAKKHPTKVIPSFGLHPWHLAKRSTRWLESLQHLLEDHPTAGVGECGLDRWIENHDLDDQLRVLIPQLELATNLDRPLTLHCLRAWGPLLECLQQEKLPARGFLLHAYGGSRELVPAFADLGAYFSFSGYFLNERKKQQLEVFQNIPTDRLLIETDAPAMSLPPELQTHHFPTDRAKNHPANLQASFQHFCHLLALEKEEARSLLDKNETRFFSTRNCA